MVVRAAQILPMALLALPGCAAGYGGVLRLDGDRVQGNILYDAYCVSCHGETGAGGIGPPLTERVPLLTDEEILTAIEEGPGDMTGFAGDFTNQELADLLFYLTAAFSP